jgi:tetratricopeptide (TPR) repeat protein
MKKKILIVAAVAFAVGFAIYGGQRYRQAALVSSIAGDALGNPTLIKDLGAHSFALSDVTPEVQRWFDQGLKLAYAFNHFEAQRAFQKAAQLDPACAMCWWGTALVLGPHINAGMDPANAALAWEHLQKALAAPRASTRERAYIEALSKRYVEVPEADRRELDVAYANAMRALAEKYPDDLDARVLFAEAMMDLHPWDFHDRTGAPKPWTPEIVTLLESVLKVDPDHPGANHYYIHAIESSSDPDRGLDAARRLLKLAPAAGHLVHMPAHIFMRTGLYHEASEANALGIAADEAYLSSCKPGPGIYPLGYVPHNYHFLWASASMEGDSERALDAAAETARRMDLDQSRQPGYAALQHYASAPMYALVRFGRWSEILSMPQPPADLAYPNAVWRYARGMALVKQNKLGSAQMELDALETLAAEPQMEQMGIWDLNDFASVLRVAERVLAGELAAARGEYEAAIATLNQAVEAEAALNYDEPSAWYYPVRQTLGAVLLEADRPGAAQAIFEQDLRAHRNNGWSLFGLAQSLEAQGRKTQAAEAMTRFREAWKHADVELKRAAF